MELGDWTGPAQTVPTSSLTEGLFSGQGTWAPFWIPRQMARGAYPVGLMGFEISGVELNVRRA